jgi:hypothetical protein
VKSRALLNGSKKFAALPASIGWRSDLLCDPNSSGSLAMFTAICRASSRVSGFVFSFEHLAARLKNRHHGGWIENTSNLTVSAFRAAKQCASLEPSPDSARFQSCALTSARHVESYLRKAWERQRGARALALKMALCSATLQVNPAAWRY